MRKELIVGLVFMAAMVLLATFTIIIADINPFAKTHDIRVRFTNVAGLKPGDAVQVDGAQFGRVEDVTPEKDGGLSVRLRLTRPVKMHEDYKIRIKSASPLGGRLVSIEPGDPKNTPLAPDAQLEGSAYGADIMDSLYDLVKDMKDGKGTVAMLIKDPEVYKNVLEATESFKNFGRQLEGKESLIGKLVSEESGKMYDEAAEAVSSFSRIGTSIDQGEGSLGKLVRDDGSAYNTVKAAFVKADNAFGKIDDIAEEIKKGKSTFGRLVYDKEMGEDVRAAARSISIIATNMAEGKGTMGKLMTDEELYDDTKAMMKSLGSLGKGEGTLGKLINDSTLHDEAEKLLKEIRAAVEDAREQAPISSFGSLLLSGFR